MIHTTNPKRLFTTLLVSATIGMAVLPAQAQSHTHTPSQIQGKQVTPTTSAAKGDGVDHRQCKALRRTGTPLPGYCF